MDLRDAGTLGSPGTLGQGPDPEWIAIRFRSVSEPERRELHRLLSLPSNRPMFRKSNRFAFPHERGPYLIDVHESVGDHGRE